MASDMSAATKELLGRVRQLVPPMLDKFHKGASPCHGPGRREQGADVPFMAQDSWAV